MAHECGAEKELVEWAGTVVGRHAACFAPDRREAKLIEWRSRAVRGKL